ncbi:MAG: DUF1631 family protein, partial [Dokdonella sp.]
MGQTTQAAGGEPAGEKKLVRLAERNLAPRVRAVLSGLLERTGYFEPALGLLFEEIEQNLFKQADRARSNEQQLRLFEALREIKRGKADIVPRYLAFLESSIAMLDQTSAIRQTSATQKSNRAVKLELVDSGDLEISLAVQDIASKAEIRHTQSLHLLGHRFGVIAGQPAYEAEFIPLGPLALTSAMRFSLQDFDLGVNEKILVFQAFDRAVMAHIGTFYDTINKYLAEQRVLPNLQFRARREGRPDNVQAGEDDTEGSGEKVSENVVAAQPAPTAGRRATATSGNAVTANSTDASQGDDLRDALLFSSLRGLLAERRRGVGQPNPASASNYLASREDLQSVLGSLQSNPIALPRGDARLGARSVGHLKQELLNKLR